ncbi:hypothetical protein HN446_01095 [bacterium]|nr:hypothetical protein [bacterium]
MRIDVSVIEKTNDGIDYIGSIEGGELKITLRSFKENGLKNLCFVGWIGNTIFNSKQSKEILKEIEHLFGEGLLPKIVYKLIKDGAERVESSPGVHYLLFEGE